MLTFERMAHANFGMCVSGCSQIAWRHVDEQTRMNQIVLCTLEGRDGVCQRLEGVEQYQYHK